MPPNINRLKRQVKAKIFISFYGKNILPFEHEIGIYNLYCIKLLFFVKPKSV